MAKLIYIDSEEEIISVIGRLRKVIELEVSFAVPKRAIFLQSLVNLRLLDREAKKLGKKLTLVMQDEISRELAKKAGIEVTAFFEGDRLEVQNHAALTPSNIQDESVQFPDNINGGVLPALEKPARLPRSESLGTSGFFSGKKRESPVESDDHNNKQENQNHSFFTMKHSATLASRATNLSTILKSSAPQQNDRKLLVRDRTPKRLTMLNSAKLTEVKSSPCVVAAPILGVSNVSFSSDPAHPFEAQSSSSDNQKSVPFKQLTQQPSLVTKTLPHNLSFFSPKTETASMATIHSHSVQDTPLVRFYRQEESRQDDYSVGHKDVSDKKTHDVHVNEHHADKKDSLRGVVFAFIVLTVLVVGGVIAFFLLPKAQVTVFLKDQSDIIDEEISANIAEEAVNVNEKTMPIRLIEKEVDISHSFASTGESAMSDKRARGMIAISNAYGSEVQSLVATTRFESSDGKIFRLVRSVVIPGKKTLDGKIVPGVIDAEVVADDSGDAYNIDPTSFTIPGLKGGPKFTTITAVSTKPFLGGGSVTASIASVSASDVTQAKESSEKDLLETLKVELEKELESGEKLLPGAIDFQVISSGAFPGIGAVASNFDYRFRIAVRAFVFLEEDVNLIVATPRADVPAREIVSVEYSMPRPDFFAKSMTVRIRLSVKKDSLLDLEILKSKILGKSVNDIQMILPEYPDIQKIEVVFWPEFMAYRIPSYESRVDILTETVKR